MWDPWAKTRASDELRGRLKWFLFGRVIVVSCFLAMFGVSFLRGGDHYAFSFHWLLAVVVVTYGLSIVSALLVAQVEQIETFTHAQIGYDILLITGVIHITGGVDSPFPFLYSLPIINSAILLFGNGAMVSALLAAAAYDALTFALTSGFIASASTFPPSHPDLQLGLRLVTTDCTFILIAYLSASSPAAWRSPNGCSKRNRSSATVSTFSRRRSPRRPAAVSSPPTPPAASQRSIKSPASGSIPKRRT